MKFRSKQAVIIEAEQWFKNGDHSGDGDERFPPKLASPNPYLPGGPLDGSARDPRYSGEFAGELLEGKVVRYYRHPGVPGTIQCGLCEFTMHNHGWIDTPSGGLTVCPGDWIITGINGEVYPCKPDIFEATYESTEKEN